MDIHYQISPNGQIERLKTRLTAHTYTYCINYFETFYPVVRLYSVRILLSVEVVKQ